MIDTQDNMQTAVMLEIFGFTKNVSAKAAIA